jgi:hypothetical protein
MRAQKSALAKKNTYKMKTITQFGLAALAVGAFFGIILPRSAREDLSPDGKSENGGPKCHDVCGHRVEHSAVGRKNPG